MSTPEDGRPDPKFVEQLEWQLRSEVRRHERFRPVRRSRGTRRLVVTVLLSLLVGFATATAAQRIGDRHDARYLRQQAEGAVELAEMRLHFVQEILDEAAARGDADADDPQYLAWDRRRAQTDVERARLQLEEIEATNESPRDDLVAPLVAGRDFVLERLELERRMLEDRARMLHVGSEGSEDDPDTRRTVEHEVALVEAQLARVASDIDLRARFLGGAVSGEEVLRSQRADQARARLTIAETRIGQLEPQLEKVRRRHDRGEAGTKELRAAEYQLAVARVEARLARLDMQAGGER